MKKFLEKYENNIQGVISGFDRLIFRGGISFLMYKKGMESYLNFKRILLKNFKDHALELSTNLKTLAKDYAEQQKRPFIYLAGNVKGKEEMARELALKENVTKGLVCIFSTLENCNSYKVVGNRTTHKLELKYYQTKCLHLYYYWIDPQFGLMHGRIQTWYPFNIQFYINGKEWLANLMRDEKISFEQVDNCFTSVSDFNLVKELTNKQLKHEWTKTLNEFSKLVNPIQSQILSPEQCYYWTTHQSEWATDILFKDSQMLNQIYPDFVHHSILTFNSKDVIRFLGKKININGAIPQNLNQEVITNFKDRTEGVRVKHSVGPNSVKFYDKAGSILRVETTINQPKGFKVYRPTKKDNQLKWQPMRKSVIDIYRRGEISQKVNERTLDSLAIACTKERCLTQINSCLNHVIKNGKRVRGLDPFGKDLSILNEISAGGYQINGFRNRDIRNVLFPNLITKDEIKKHSSKMSRYFRILRAHGIIKKIAKTHRYQLTEKGIKLITALKAIKELRVNDVLGTAA